MFVAAEQVEVEVEDQSSEPSSLFSAPDDQPGSKKLSLQAGAGGWNNGRTLGPKNQEPILEKPRSWRNSGLILEEPRSWRLEPHRIEQRQEVESLQDLQKSGSSSPV